MYEYLPLDIKHPTVSITTLSVYATRNNRNMKKYFPLKPWQHLKLFFRKLSFNGLTSNIGAVGDEEFEDT
jgi:hypothetical protein